MTDFIRPIRHTTISKVQGVPRERAIRIYPEFTGGLDVRQWRYNLQVRGPATLANRSDGADFIVATGSCSVEDLRALHAAIGACLAEIPE